MSVPLSRRAESIISWPFGVTWTSWIYLWRTTPVHRRELAGSAPADLPPAPPDRTRLDGAQLPVDGSGPLFHRTYTGRIRDAGCSAEAMIERLRADPNLVAPRARALQQDEGPAVADADR